MARTTTLAACVLVLGMTSDALAQSGGEMRLSTEDHIAIEQLYARYNQTIDSGDHEGWAKTFADDGALGNTTGHAALAKTSQNWRDNRGGATKRHWNTNLLITGVTPEGVTARVYLMVFDGATLQASQVGVYEDLIVKTPAGWRFKKRQLRSDPRPQAK